MASFASLLAFTSLLGFPPPRSGSFADANFRRPPPTHPFCNAPALTSRDAFPSDDLLKITAAHPSPNGSARFCFACPQVLFIPPTPSNRSVRLSSRLYLALPFRDAGRSPWVTNASSLPCRPQTPWYDRGEPSAFAPIVRARPFPIFGRPVHPRDCSLDYDPEVLLKPFGFRLTTDTLSCPIFIGPGEALPPPSDISPWSGTERDFNPPDAFAARHTLWGGLTPPARSSSATAPRLPDADHPASYSAAGQEVSRFPYKERASMPGSQTTQGRPGTRSGVSGRIAFRCESERRHPGLIDFRGSMAGLYVPLSTLRVAPRGTRHMTLGRYDLLDLYRKGLSPSTLCRSPGARFTADSTNPVAILS